MTTGDENTMLNKHEELLQNHVLPDIDILKKITAAHEQNIKKLEENQKEFNNRFDTLKNTQDSTKNEVQSMNINLQQIGTDLKNQNEKLFDHVLGIDKQQREFKQASTLASLDTRVKVAGVVFGSGGLIGLIVLGFEAYQKFFG